MKLDFLASATSTVIHYQAEGFDPMVQREGQRFEFLPQQVRILINGDEFQVQVEGPRKLARGILSPIQRITERFYRYQLKPDSGVPLWILDLAEFWQDAIRKGALHQEIDNERDEANMRRTGRKN